MFGGRQDAGFPLIRQDRRRRVGIALPGQPGDETGDQCGAVGSDHGQAVGKMSPADSQRVGNRRRLGRGGFQVGEQGCRLALQLGSRTGRKNK